jgi:hypothetical protein
MNKKIVLLLLITIIPCCVFAQEIKFSGEAKTGVYWRQNETAGKDPYAFVGLHNTDDAGGLSVDEKSANPGRFRLNIEYDNGNNTGMKTRLNWEGWGPNNVNAPPTWAYAFGYGNYFDDQLTVSVGKLGGSPWGTGGPEMWKELETGVGGMRVEWKPAFVPGLLNVGFVLNSHNSDKDQGWDKDKPMSLLNILRESVVGFAYTNDYFLVRFAYRFDDEADANQDNKISGGKGEEEIVYRLEERVLSNHLPGLQVWALGYLFGLFAEKKDMQWYRNWLFVQYAPDAFTAQVRFGYDYIESRSEFYVKPSFYLNLFDKLISVGTAFMYSQDFGDNKVKEGSPYHFLEIEPKIQVNFPSSYIAFVYNWRQEYINPAQVPEGLEPLKRTQWMNLRFCIYF